MRGPGTNKKASLNRCAKLRWKGQFIQAELDPADDFSNDTALWCQQTFTCLGPDGKLVDEYECSPARACYEQL